MKGVRGPRYDLGMTGTGAVGSGYGELLITSLVVLGAVCIAAYVAVRFASRLFATGRARGTHLLDVVARLPLEPRRSLYVVEVAGKTLLVGTSEMGLSVLSELDAAEVKTRIVKPQTFADLVKTAWSKRKGLGVATDVSAETPAGQERPAVGQGDVSAETPAGQERPAVGQGGVSAEARERPAPGQSDDSAETRTP
jgi:flagellar biogenesis protein FliO